MRHRYRQWYLSAMWMLSAAASAAVNDIYPTDFVALPSGSVNVTIYTGQQKISGPYTEGVRTSEGRAISNQMVMRASRVFAVGDNDQYAWAPVVVLGQANVNANPTLGTPLFGRHADGMTDLRLGNAFWFHVDRPNRTYGLIGLFAILPTGDYTSSQVLNVGEHRTRYVLSAGWMQPIGGKWLMEVSPEIAVYGENDQYLRTRIRQQDTSYALTSYLRYRHSDAWQFYGGAQINRGGAAQVNGVQSTGAPENTRMYLGTILLTSAKRVIRRMCKSRMACDCKANSAFVI